MIRLNRVTKRYGDTIAVNESVSANSPEASRMIIKIVINFFIGCPIYYS